MPPTWVAVDSDSYFGVAWAADCGPYIGGDTPIPPVAMPADAEELDYYIGVPNPSGSVEGFQDGSYDGGHVTDVWRFRSGDDEATAASITTIDPGSHLIAVFYPLGFPDVLADPPSASPLSLVPVIYVAGGHGSYSTGHYSEWFDGASVTSDPTSNVFRTIGVVTRQTIIGDDSITYPDPPIPSGAIDTNVRDDLESLLADALTETTARGGSSGSSSLFGAQKQGVTGGPIGGYQQQFYSGVVEFGQECITIEPPSAPTRDYDHSVLDGLTEGVDYGPGPDGEIINYESGVEFVNWLDWSFTLDMQYLANAQTDEFDTVYVPENVVAVTVSYRAVTSALLTANDGDVPFQVFGSGIGLADVPTDLPAPTSPPAPLVGDEIRGGAIYDVELPLSSLGNEPTLSIFSQDSLLGAATEPFDDFIVHNFAGSVDLGVPVTGSKGTVVTYVSRWEFDPVGVGELITPQANFQQPRFRYWVPGVIVAGDAVYIFGGHWQRIPGTPDVMVKKTDGTWIPIVDGLAPPLL